MAIAIKIDCHIVNRDMRADLHDLTRDQAAEYTTCRQTTP